MNTVVLVYNGDPRTPNNRGSIPGICHGLEAGQYVAITDDLLRSLKRPVYDEASFDFAEFLQGVYNGNHPVERWSVDLKPDQEPVQSGEAIEEPLLADTPVEETAPAAESGVSEGAEE